MHSQPFTLSVAFETDQPLAAYGPLAAAVEGYGFDGVAIYNDLLYQPSWLPLRKWRVPRGVCGWAQRP